jgi:F0F1-type ATP synthase assembly protein I
MIQENRDGQGNKSLSGNDFAGAGIQFAVALVLSVILGSWLDKRYGTGPLFILLGLAVGGGGGFYSLYRKVTAFQKADDEMRRKKRDEGR